MAHRQGDVGDIPLFGGFESGPVQANPGLVPPGSNNFHLVQSGWTDTATESFQHRFLGGKTGCQ